MRVESWVIIVLIVFGISSFYDERLMYMEIGAILTFIGMTLYQAHKKK